MRTGQFKLARNALNEAYRINSNYEPTILNLSVLEFNEQNYSESLKWLTSIKSYETMSADNFDRIQVKLQSAE